MLMLLFAITYFVYANFCELTEKKNVLNWQIVQQQAEREGEEDIHLSGSELDSCSSSERESSDDDITQRSAADDSGPLPLSEEATSSKRVRN